MKRFWDKATSYLVVDIETTIRNTGPDSVGTFKASPFNPRNALVLVGHKRGYGNVQTATAAIPPPDGAIVVMHQAKFDLHYLMRDLPEWREWLHTGLVWDTALAEYLLSGQLTKYPSLDYCAEKYGGTKKDTLIKEYWAAGTDTTEIPREQLLEYLEHDVRNTEIVYLAQRERAKALGMEDLIESNMGALLATVDMERNGMAFDLAEATEESKRLEKDLDAHKAAIESNFAPILPGLVPNASSRDQLSLVLFGGTYEVPVGVPVVDAAGSPVLYKTGARKGEVKTRQQAEPRTVLGAVKPEPVWATKKAGIWQTNDGVLAKLPQEGLVGLVLAYRKLEKDLSTYYRGYSDLVWADGCIHPSLEMTSTATARFSCSRPNLQNVTGAASDIKRCFVSRWGAEGRLCEADLSQIEVVVQAWLSGDEQMKQDVRDGVDFHCKRLAYKLGEPYEAVLAAYQAGDKEIAAQRKLIKVVSFQKAYGAGVTKIAEGLGLSRDEVKSIMDAEDALYPGVPKMQQTWINTVKESWRLGPSTLRTPSGYPAGMGWMATPEGKRYVFVEDDAPEFLQRKGTKTSFRPTQIKNYAIQGFAAEILKCILNSLRQQYEHQRMLMVCTVHDSIVFDVHELLVDQCVRAVLRTIEFAPELLRKRYGIEFDLPVRADVSVGVNWAEMKKYIDKV